MVFLFWRVFVDYLWKNFNFIRGFKVGNLD